MDETVKNEVGEEIEHQGEDAQMRPLMLKLEKYRITPDKQLPKMDFLFRLFGKPCFPRRELVAITGKAKSGKTFVSSMLMAVGSLTPNLASPPNPLSKGRGGMPAAGEGSGMPPMTFIANGDRAVVRRVRHVHEQHGFRFADVTMTFPDYDDYELTATVLLDTLTSEAPALTREQQDQLYNKVMADYADIPQKQERLKKVREDKYFNALQVKFAYAATCHKAQGGQWAHVYVDQGYMTDDMLTPDYLHWLYTAFTRATEQLYLVNWPKTQIDDLFE